MLQKFFRVLTTFMITGSLSMGVFACGVSNGLKVPTNMVTSTAYDAKSVSEPKLWWGIQLVDEKNKTESTSKPYTNLANFASPFLASFASGSSHSTKKSFLGENQTFLETSPATASENYIWKAFYKDWTSDKNNSFKKVSMLVNKNANAVKVASQDFKDSKGKDLGTVEIFLPNWGWHLDTTSLTDDDSMPVTDGADSYPFDGYANKDQKKASTKLIESLPENNGEFKSSNCENSNATVTTCYPKYDTAKQTYNMRIWGSQGTKNAQGSLYIKKDATTTTAQRVVLASHKNQSLNFYQTFIYDFMDKYFITVNYKLDWAIYINDKGGDDPKSFTYDYKIAPSKIAKTIINGKEIMPANDSGVISVSIAEKN